MQTDVFKHLENMREIFYKQNFIIACFTHKFLNNIHYSAELSYPVILAKNYFELEDTNALCNKFF